jgi:hypothetical protein
MVCTEENLETKSRKNGYASAFSRVNTAVKKLYGDKAGTHGAKYARELQTWTVTTFFDKD